MIKDTLTWRKSLFLRYNLKFCQFEKLIFTLFFFGALLGIIVALKAGAFRKEFLPKCLFDQSFGTACRNVVITNSPNFYMGDCWRYIGFDALNCSNLKKQISDCFASLVVEMTEEQKSDGQIKKEMFDLLMAKITGGLADRFFDFRALLSF